MLQTQAVAVSLPGWECESPAHSSQASAVAAPVRVKNLPPAQLLHADDAFNALYFPAAHAAHGADPSDSLNLPLAQATHGPSGGPV